MEAILKLFANIWFITISLKCLSWKIKRKKNFLLKSHKMTKISRDNWRYSFFIICVPSELI
jgi:hypothetical protein